MTSTKNQARRLVAVGAFAVAAVAAPFAVSTLSTAADSDAVALPPGCTAHFGNIEDGICLDYAEDGIDIGTPEFGLEGGNGSSGPGFSTGPLLPGRIINTPVA